MIRLTIEIDNYGDYCGKCKQKWCLNPNCKGELEFMCSVFHKKLGRTVGGRRLCRLDQCLALDPPEEEKLINPINKFPCCPVCGSYTREKADKNGVSCTCGWSIDTDGDEDFDPENLEIYEKEVLNE